MRIKKFNRFIKENMSNEIDLPNDIIEISNAYFKAGKDIFLVGGAIRDFLQGKTPKDYDLVTNALPHESKQILKDFNVSDEQGKNFGVLRVYTKDEPEGHEIASYRKDISGGRDTKGDDDKVEMGNHITMEDDCQRRDLTINALYYDINKKKIIDLVGGVDDIKNNVIKAVGDPSERFKEDRLRICRAFRFSARIGGEIDKETADAIKSDNRLRNIGPKDDVSQERIWEEFKKSFKQALDYNRYLNYYTEFDMWGEVFPGTNINTDLVESKNFVVIISNLFKNEELGALKIGYNLENRLIREYKIESELAKKVVFLVSFLNFRPEDVFDFYKKRQQSGIDESTILEWLEVNNINDESMIKFIGYKPTVNSKYLIDKGFSGRELGLEIKRLEIEKFMSK